MHTSNIEHEWFVPGKILWTSPMSGVEVTELADGGYYFAPPGDFSKVDFSACHELGESVNLDATLNRMGFTPFDAGRYAKPALPSLMTEAGERYRGLGWCDD